MIVFERTGDMDLVRRVMTHPAVYPQIADDGCPPASEYRPSEHPAYLYLLVRRGADVLGLFAFTMQNAVTVEVHTCLLPAARARLESGARISTAAARGAAAWIWANTRAQRIVTSVPAFNRLALRLAERAGMKRYGVNEKSFQKHGILHDQILLGLSRPESN